MSKSRPASHGLSGRATAGLIPTVLTLLALGPLALPGAVSAAETGTTTATTTTPAAQPPPSEASAPAAGPATPPTSTTPNPTTTTGPGQATAPVESTEAGPGPASGAGAPQVEKQHAQSVTPGDKRAGRGAKHAQPPGQGAGGAANPGGSTGGQSSNIGGASEAQARAGHRAPSPSTLTPSLPLDLGGSLPGVSGFFVESFQVPPFLLPIYQAAGTAYGIPWQVLAAINEVETDYGRDLSVSSAGAEGWMQFLPSTWQTYGVDANGDGFEDPYNPADAIFAAARYLRAAGGDKNIKGAIYSYNHSQAYVDSVMLRAQLLGATPPELLGAITGLTESRFPVHAPAHFGDGFMTVPGPGSASAKTLAGTTIYSQAGAPVIAVQDGEIVQIGDSPALGRFVTLRDGYGNTYVYSQLGSVASLYPVLAPREHTAVSPRIDQSDASVEPVPDSPATAGAQPRSAISEGATVSGFALGATAGLEPAPVLPQADPSRSTSPADIARPAPHASKAPRAFKSGPDEVYLHTLAPGVQVLAGTVLGHVGAQSAGASGTGAGGKGVVGAGAPGAPATQAGGGPHMFFQIKPAGAGAPLIDPKPILDGWVALENTSIFRAKGENPFLATSPTVGQVLLESKEQLQQQVVRDASIHMRTCERQDIQTGRVDKAVLATLEYLSVSGLKPAVAGIRCAGAAPASEGNASASSGDRVRITAINGIPVAGGSDPARPGSIADTTIRKLLTLQGLNRPRRIVSLTSIPGAANTVADRRARDYLEVVFGARGAGAGHAASASSSALSAGEWIKLVARLGEIPDPTVSSGPSTAAIPDRPGTPESAGGSAGGSGSSTAPGATPGTSEGGAGGNG